MRASLGKVCWSQHSSKMIQPGLRVHQLGASPGSGVALSRTSITKRGRVTALFLSGPLILYAHLGHVGNRGGPLEMLGHQNSSEQ